MTDVFLYSGEANPSDVKLRDPTTTGAAASLTATLAVTLADVTAAIAGTLGHSATETATLDGVSVAFSGAVGHPATESATLDDVTAAFAGSMGHPASSAITLDDVTVAVLAEVSGSVAPVVPVVAAGGIGHSKTKIARPQIAVVTVDGQDYRVPIDKLQAFLDSLKEDAQDPDTVERKTKKAKKQGKKAVAQVAPPKITVKSAPVEYLPMIQSHVDRSNEILAVLWRRALERYLLDMDDEEALLLLLT